ncbi:hypothetical protein BWK57_11755 [Flavobacterium columnare]|uniref:DUF5712 family protein n=1 Tax=Flavobacterium columnare TaxID=996 RepID=UPI000CDAFDBF|nr:DUF5712 family protein [Flavobacterium columnare]POR20961.1 hypothetical protein BWK57_11755 [Flavobacterium columnare]
MYIKFTSHNTQSGFSSKGIIDYLEKENISSNQIYGVPLYDEKFFTNDLNTDLSKDEIINNLDNNISSKRSKEESNFYMLNVSPSKKELSHMEKIAEDYLSEKGIYPSKENDKNLFYLEQKDQVMKMQLKLYSKDIMKEYAKNFNREIYINENGLPNQNEKKEINKEVDKIYNNILEEYGVPKKIEIEKSTEFKKANIKILNENKNYLIVELKNNDLKSEVSIPKKALLKDKQNNFILPKNLLEEKLKEVEDKNTLVQINYSSKVEKDISIKGNKESVVSFKIPDTKNNLIEFSVNEKNLIEKEGKYFIDKHNFDLNYKNAVERKLKELRPNLKYELYKSIGTKKGFDLRTRPLEEKDFLWYGKIEKERTFKFNDKEISENREVSKEIKQIQNSKKLSEKDKKNIIKQLNEKYNLNSKGEIIVEGMKKEGMNYHAHIIVSRHDNTMKKPENKISLSPLANAKDSELNTGSRIGFTRDNFFKNSEKIFDQKFSYEREKSESYETNKSNKNALGNTAKGEIKSFVKKELGLNQVKKELNPINDVKKELGLSNIPTRLPTNFMQVGIKIVRKVLDKGLGY